MVKSPQVSGYYSVLITELALIEYFELDLQDLAANLKRIFSKTSLCIDTKLLWLQILDYVQFTLACLDH